MPPSPRPPGRAPAADQLDWDDLHILLAIARHGRLAATAEELGIDAADVGRRIAALESRVGEALFERTPVGLTPGRLVLSLLPELERMEESALSLERARVAWGQPATGTVRVAASDAFAQYFLLGELAALRGGLPGVTIELIVGHGAANLARREADIALRFFRPEDEDLTARQVATLRWSVYAAPAYLAGRRVDFTRSAEGEDVIRWGGPRLQPAVLHWMDTWSRPARTALVVHRLHTMVEGCARGIGLAALPGAMAQARGGLTCLLATGIPGSDTPLWLVVHKDLCAVPRVRAVADALAGCIEAARDRLHGL